MTLKGLNDRAGRYSQLSGTGDRVEKLVAPIGTFERNVLKAMVGETPAHIAIEHYYKDLRASGISVAELHAAQPAANGIEARIVQAFVPGPDLKQWLLKRAATLTLSRSPVYQEMMANFQAFTDAIYLAWRHDANLRVDTNMVNFIVVGRGKLVLTDIVPPIYADRMPVFKQSGLQMVRDLYCDIPTQTVAALAYWLKTLARGQMRDQSLYRQLAGDCRKLLLTRWAATEYEPALKELLDLRREIFFSQHLRALDRYTSSHCEFSEFLEALDRASITRLLQVK